MKFQTEFLFESGPNSSLNFENSTFVMHRPQNFPREQVVWKARQQVAQILTGPPSVHL